MIDAEKEMKSLADRRYAEFSMSLNPGTENMLGVRLPDLRRLAKRIAADDWRAYLKKWRRRYFEDCMLRGFVISYARVDVEERLRLFADFIPEIDTWSVCDSFCGTWKPKGGEKEALWNFILPYLDTGKEYMMRYCVVSMMAHFIDERHIGDIIGLIDSHNNDGYYYKMAAAWNLATCLAKFPEETFAYLSGENNLDDFTFNKTIQKSIESFRISDGMKETLRSMKRSVR